MKTRHSLILKELRNERKSEHGTERAMPCISCWDGTKLRGSWGPGEDRPGPSQKHPQVGRGAVGMPY